ncbi:hypothetical protein ACLKA6_007361 [Drosophila palustris]
MPSFVPSPLFSMPRALPLGLWRSKNEQISMVRGSYEGMVTLTSVAICLTGRPKRQQQQQQVPPFAVGHKWQLKAVMVIIEAGPLAWLGLQTTTTALDIVINFDLCTWPACHTLMLHAELLIRAALIMPNMVPFHIPYARVACDVHAISSSEEYVPFSRNTLRIRNARCA